MQPTRETGAAGRMLVLAYLGCLLVSKLADANTHPDLWYLPVVAACFALPLWYVSGRARGPWLRMPGLLLGLQAVMTLLGFVLFRDNWVGGVSGLLAGLVLLVVPSPRSWWIFGALVVAEVALWLAVGLPYGPPANAISWLLVVFGNVSFGLFGLARLAVLVERLESTQELLADSAVELQRLATANDVRATIMHRLDDLAGHVRLALAGPPAVVGDELQRAGEAARDAAASARRMVGDLRAPAGLGAAEGSERVSPALARGVVVIVLLLFGTQYVMNVAAPGDGGATPTLLTSALAVVVAVLMTVLQLRHSRFLPGGARPAAWQWTLLAQFVLAFAAYPLFGAPTLGSLSFVSASVLLLVRSPVRWLVFGVLAASLPLLTVLNGADVQGFWFQMQWSAYAVATHAATGLLIYGLSRLSGAASELEIARQDLADLAAARERLRISRDAHDTLGLALSTIALKSDLAQSLLGHDNARARREIVQMLHLARAVESDAESIVTGTLVLDLDAEFATAREVLTSAGVTTTVACDNCPLEPGPGSELAAILREAVTNVLRHSTARECSITLGDGGGDISLVVENDGAPSTPASQGHGLNNIAERTARMGGSMSTESGGGRFRLVARLPSRARVPG